MTTHTEEHPDKTDKQDKHDKSDKHAHAYPTGDPDAPDKRDKTPKDEAAEEFPSANPDVAPGHPGLGTYKYSSLLHVEQEDEENQDQNEESEKTDESDQEKRDADKETDESGQRHRRVGLQKSLPNRASLKNKRKPARKPALTKKSPSHSSQTRHYTYR
jgi:hypothetical protein